MNTQNSLPPPNSQVSDERTGERALVADFWPDGDVLPSMAPEDVDRLAARARELRARRPGQPELPL